MAYNYIVRFANGRTEAHTQDEIISNAKQQEADGIAPRYYLRGIADGVGGWLVWSTWGGCGVVFKTKKGTYSIVEGVQGDFIYK